MKISILFIVKKKKVEKCGIARTKSNESSQRVEAGMPRSQTRKQKQLKKAQRHEQKD